MTLDPRWKNPQGGAAGQLYLWAQDLIKELRKSAKLDDEDPIFTGSLTGSPIIGGTAANSHLVLQSTSGVGTTDYIDFLVGNNGAVRAARITSNGSVVINGDTAVSGLGALLFQVHRTAAGLAANSGFMRWTNDANGPQYEFTKSRGTTPGAHTAVVANDDLGIIRIVGSDGSVFREAGRLQFTTEITSAGVVQMRADMRGSNGAGSSILRQRWDASGNVLMGDSTGNIATNASDGFLWVQTCAGAPTGTPNTAYNSWAKAPIVIDTTNNRLYFYSTGAWRNAGP